MAHRPMGLVMKIIDDRMIVVTDEGDFLDLPVTGQAPPIGARIALPATVAVPAEPVPADPPPVRRAPFPTRWLSYAAAAAVIFAFGWLLRDSIPGLGPNPVGPAAVAVVAHATLDINPSVDLDIDAQQRVQAAQGRNDEGKLLVSSQDVRGMPLDDAVPALVDRAAQLGFIRTDGRSAILLTYTPAPEAVAGNVPALHREELRQRIAAKLQVRQLSAAISLEEAPAALRRQAKENGLSPNQQRILNQARERGLKLDVDQMRRQPIGRALEQAGTTLENVLGLPERLVPGPDARPGDQPRRGGPDRVGPERGRPGSDGLDVLPLPDLPTGTSPRPQAGQPGADHKPEAKPKNEQGPANGQQAHPTPPDQPQTPSLPQPPSVPEVTVPSVMPPPPLPGSDGGTSDTGSSTGSGSGSGLQWR